MREIEALLGIEDIMRIFNLSRVSIYRKVKEAREGNSQFPLPLWGKQKLRWNAADVEAFCRPKTVSQVQVQVNNSKQQRQSAKDTRARQASVEQALARHGIVINNTK